MSISSPWPSFPNAETSWFFDNGALKQCLSKVKNNPTNLKLWECKFFIVLIWVSIISEPHFTDSPRVHPWASVPFFEMKNWYFDGKKVENFAPRCLEPPIWVRISFPAEAGYRLLSTARTVGDLNPLFQLKTRLNVPRGCEVELRTIYWLISELSHKWHHRTSLTLQLVVDLSISF